MPSQPLALLRGQPTRSQEQVLLKPLALLECQPTRSQEQALLQPMLQPLKLSHEE